MNIWKLINRIFKTKPKNYNFKNLDYIYIDTNNYTNLINNIYNSMTSNPKNRTQGDIITNVLPELDIDYSFVNTIHEFIISKEDRNLLLYKVFSLINKYNLKFNIRENSKEIIVSLSITADVLSNMISEVLDGNVDLEDPFYRYIIFNISSMVHENLLLSKKLDKVDLHKISLEEFDNLDFYYTDNLLVPNIQDDSMHVYTLENHLQNYIEYIREMDKKFEDTIVPLFNLILAIDNPDSDIRTLLLSNSKVIKVINGQDDRTDSERLILSFSLNNIKKIVNILIDYINFYKEDNNKLNSLKNAKSLYNIFNKYLSLLNSDVIIHTFFRE